jgi:hypothetical protein
MRLPELSAKTPHTTQAPGGSATAPLSCPGPFKGVPGRPFQVQLRHREDYQTEIDYSPQLQRGRSTSTKNPRRSAERSTSTDARVAEKARGNFRVWHRCVTQNEALRRRVEQCEIHRPQYRSDGSGSSQHFLLGEDWILRANSFRARAVASRAPSGRDRRLEQSASDRSTPNRFLMS